MLLLMNVLTYYLILLIFCICGFSMYRTRTHVPIYTLSNYFDKYNSSNLFLLYIMLPLLVEVNKDGFHLK